MTQKMTVEDIDQLRQEIDEEIRRLTSSVLKLRIRRNSLAAIFKLPSEVLTEIFLFIAPAYPVHSSLGWVRSVTHVCHHWRMLALNTPMLWSHICFEKKEWMVEMLRRSKDTPLVIRAEISRDHYSGWTRPSTVVECLRGRLSRIGVLHVTLRGTEDEHAPTYAIRDIISMLHEPSAVLHTIHLHESTLPNKGVSIPSDVFHIQQHLTKLELINITLDWPALPETLLQRLRHLSLADFRTDSPRAELFDVLGALERTINLEYFRLALYALPAPSRSSTVSQSRYLLFPSAVVQHRPIRLPKLTELQLKGTLRDVSCFIRHITPPTTAPLSVDIDCLKLLNPMARPEDLSSVLAFVNACFHVGPTLNQSLPGKAVIKSPPLLPNNAGLGSPNNIKQPIRRLVITDLAGDIFQPHIELMGWTGATGFGDDSQAQMNISFRWDTDAGRSLVPGILTNVCGMLPLRDVQSFVVEYSQMIPHGLWTDLFSQMRDIRSLSVYGERAALELPIALIPPEFSDNPATTAVMAGIDGCKRGDFISEGQGYDLYLPKLCSLEITRMGFSRTDPLLFQRLRDCLSEREVGNVGVKYVTMYGWGDTENESITQLADMGVRIAVDPDAQDKLGTHRIQSCMV